MGHLKWQSGHTIEHHSANAASESKWGIRDTKNTYIWIFNEERSANGMINESPFHRYIHSTGRRLVVAPLLNLSFITQRRHRSYEPDIVVILSRHLHFSRITVTFFMATVPFYRSPFFYNNNCCQICVILLPSSLDVLWRTTFNFQRVGRRVRRRSCVRQ